MQSAMESHDDEALAAAWARGDRAAGGELIERHFDAVSRFFATKAGVAADDLVHETFARCAAAVGGYGGQGSFRAFVFGVARNVLLEFIRAKVRAGVPEPDFHTSSLAELLPGLSTQYARRAEQRLLTQALQRLPLELQVVVELYYWEELPLPELASIAGVPVGTVKSRLFRARTLLREALEAVEAGGEERASLRGVIERQFTRDEAELAS